MPMDFAVGRSQTEQPRDFAKEQKPWLVPQPPIIIKRQGKLY